MPVLTKVKLDKIRLELFDRYDSLLYNLEERELISDREGAGRGRWANPETMRATKGTTFDVQLALDDFRNILNQIRALK